MLALSNAGQGDIAVRTDINKTFILKRKPASILANWQELLTPTDAVQSVNGKTGAVVLNKNDVGLDKVVNQTITVTNTSVSDGIHTFNKYTHPTYTTVSASAYKVGRDSTGHVVIGDALTYSDVGAASAAAISNATITIKQTGQSNQTFTLNGSAKTISLADTNTTYSPVFGTAVTSVTANQTGSALTGIEFGSTSVLKSVTLNNGSINETAKYLQIGTATAAIGAAANGTTTALTSVSISSTASAASPTHTHSVTTDGSVTLASGTTGDVEVAYSINGTSYTPAGSVTLAVNNFTTTDVLTGINGGAGSFTVNAPISSGTGRSARSNLTFSHTHTAASASGTAAKAFTGISTTKPT